MVFLGMEGVRKLCGCPRTEESKGQKTNIFNKEEIFYV